MKIPFKILNFALSQCRNIGRFGQYFLAMVLLVGCHPAAKQDSLGRSPTISGGTMNKPSAKDNKREPKTPKAPSVSIAVVNGSDKATLEHIESLLRTNGVESYTEGSIVYGVFVQKDDATRAVALLKKDATKRKYWIRFSNPS